MTCFFRMDMTRYHRYRVGFMHLGWPVYISIAVLLEIATCRELEEACLLVSRLRQAAWPHSILEMLCDCRRQVWIKKLHGH